MKVRVTLGSYALEINDEHTPNGKLLGYADKVICSLMVNTVNLRARAVEGKMSNKDRKALSSMLSSVRMDQN